MGFICDSVLKENLSRCGNVYIQIWLKKRRLVLLIRIFICNQNRIGGIHDKNNKHKIFILRSGHISFFLIEHQLYLKKCLLLTCLPTWFHNTILFPDQQYVQQKKLQEIQLLNQYIYKAVNSH